MPSITLIIAAVLATATKFALAQSVFAHVIVGNNGAYTVSNWESDIKLASSKGIDAFALNIAPPLEGTVSAQSALAFQAAENVGNGFKLFFSFDYLGSGTPWATDDIVSLLNQYGGKGAYFKYEGKPFVSTFEGPSNSDVSQWSTIRQAVSGGIYFVPDWTSEGPGYESQLYDGAFSWDMWPTGPHAMTTTEDKAWQSSLQPSGKSYMMGVSPWFYTNLPAYNKAWVWRGDSLWFDRWQQVLEIKPDFVEIVTWNDFGESSYIGPIYEPGIPQSSGADARPYVNGFPHNAWLETLPFQIAAYKHAVNPSAFPPPKVKPGEDKIVYWYRNAPAHAGSTHATGNASPSDINTGGYQNRYPVAEMLEDQVFTIALLSQPGSISISIGDNPAPNSKGLKAGINFIAKPFNGQTGDVRVRSSTGVRGVGRGIESAPANGVANFNAWVGCAGACGDGGGGGW